MFHSGEYENFNPFIVGTHTKENIVFSFLHRCIRGHLKDKVVILVTHQLHFLKNVDEIIVLSKGKIAERGTYEELMSNTNGRLCMLLEERREQSKAHSSKTNLKDTLTVSTAPEISRRMSVTSPDIISVLDVSLENDR